jgi:hypothetical protein
MPDPPIFIGASRSTRGRNVVTASGSASETDGGSFASASCRNEELRLLHLTRTDFANSSTEFCLSFRFCGGLSFELEADRTEMAMAKLSLASELTEARKFSRDDRLRSGTPGPETVRLRTPTLSRSWTLISFVVVVHRNADGGRDHHRAIGIKRRYDEGDRRSEVQGCRPAQGAGVDACTQNAQCLSSTQLAFSPLSCERCVARRNAN